MLSNFTNIRKCLGYIKDELFDIYPSEEIQNIAYLLLEETLSISRTELLANFHGDFDESLSHKIMKGVSELKNEKPIQYVLGKSNFYDCTILLTPVILIPRPETEELVHWILEDTAGKNVTIMDIGTGSGCIAISLARNLGSATVFAIDNSHLALETAKKSALKNKVQVSFFHHDLFSSTDTRDLPMANIIVSNPPYVMESEKKEMRRNVLDFEPHESLFVPDADPLLFYRVILKLAETNLIRREGLIYFEINERMGSKLKDLLEEFNFTDIELRKDMHGKDRMIKAKFTERKK